MTKCNQCILPKVLYFATTFAKSCQNVICNYLWGGGQKQNHLSPKGLSKDCSLKIRVFNICIQCVFDVILPPKLADEEDTTHLFKIVSAPSI